MARDHGRLRSRIWSDPDFTSLRADEQRLYVLALSQPDINYCGVVSYTPRRWAKFAADTTAAGIRKAVNALAEKRFVVVDESTEELLVRTFIRHDNVLAMPNVARAAARAWATIHSARIRAHVLMELHRLRNEPEEKGWERGWPELEPLLSESLGEGFGEGFPEGFPEGFGEPFALRARRGPLPLPLSTPPTVRNSPPPGGRSSVGG